MNRSKNSEEKAPATIYQAFVTDWCAEHGMHSVWLSSNDADDLDVFTNLLTRALQMAGSNPRVAFQESADPDTDISPRDPSYDVLLSRALGLDDDIPF